MSLLLKAFPHGRPGPRLSSPWMSSLRMSSLRMSSPWISSPRARLTVVVSVLAMVAVLLPLAASAEARSGTRKQHASRHHAAHTVPGQPPHNYVMPATSFFSFPNRSRKERLAIRKRVLATIQSVWGGRRTRIGTPLRTNGTIRIATWTFDDWDVAKALAAAHKRGVSVQVVAARSANRGHAPWRWLRKRLGTRLHRQGRPTTREMYSFARQCRGACRGPGGTPHAKYFLFDNVGANHIRNVVVQTSANLTTMAFQGQWNQAQVMRSANVYTDFMGVYRQMRLGRPVARPYHVDAMGNVVDYFFPHPGATASQDPVLQILNQAHCQGATAGGNRAGRTKVRIVQYAIYGERGVWIAKRLRHLWTLGCDVAIIYAVTSRPVLSILRSNTGRGAVPMRQSVVKDSWGNIVKYNHSKWMTITGRWGRSRATYLTFSGSANWANLAFGSDEQMQRIHSRTQAVRHLATFAKTWRQKTSRRPGSDRVVAFGRTMGAGP